MTEHFLNAALEDHDPDCVTDVFMPPGQNLYRQMMNCAELPKIMGSIIGNSYSTINKDHIYNRELKPFGCKELLKSSNDISSTIQSESEFSSHGQMTGYAENYGGSTEDGLIDVEIEEPENEGEFLMIDEPVLLINDPLCAKTFDETDPHGDNIEQDIDEGLQEVLHLIKEKDSLNQADFVAVASDKSRNPPYLIKDTTNIITKNKEPIKFCLKGADIGQIVTVTMRYSEEKYKNNPVLSCKLDQKDEDAFPFVLSAAGEEMEVKREKINEHPTVHFSLPRENVDLDEGFFYFYITVVCLNSCHKNNGKKIQLILKLVDPIEKNLIKESRFNVRACKNVKRDFKEAFPDGETSPEKILKPDSFITPREIPSQPHIVKEEVKTRSSQVNVVMIKPPVQKTPETRVITCSTTKPETPKERKFYLVQLPTVEIERNVLETIKLFGGKILNLENVYQVNDNSLDSAP